MGNRDGTLAIRQGRLVLERLAEEWPDLHLTLRTVASGPGHGSPLMDAVVAGQVGVAVVQADSLPLALPEGLTVAAVLRRADARSALVARGARSLSQLPAAAVVGVYSERDAAFVMAANPGLRTKQCTAQPEAELVNLTSGEYEALVLPVATLAELDLRDRADALLEPDEFAPAPGQGAVALVVSNEDNLAFESVYPLQHRPSFDRLRAERAFARSLTAQDAGLTCGALATVSDEGELTLLGTVVKGQAMVQATTVGDAREAEEIGRELAVDVIEQLKGL